MASESKWRLDVVADAVSDPLWVHEHEDLLARLEGLPPADVRLLQQVRPGFALPPTPRAATPEAPAPAAEDPEALEKRRVATAEKVLRRWKSYSWKETSAQLEFGL